MEKIRLEIVGLSYSQTQTGAYALVLGEEDGKRRLPIIIGSFEAQSIAIEMEKMKPSRPLTHDLFKQFAQSFGVQVLEVVIYNLVEGIFYSKIICMGSQGETVEIDARTSDAVAIALRFESPIFTHEFILSSAGIILDESADVSKEDEDPEVMLEPEISSSKITKDPSELSATELQSALQKAIDDEDYEKASSIRDEIERRKTN